MSTLLSTAALAQNPALAPLHRSMEGTRAKNVPFHYTAEEKADLQLFAECPFSLLTHYGLGLVEATELDAAHEIVDHLLRPQRLQIITHDLPRHWDPELVQNLAVGLAIWRAAHWRRPSGKQPLGGSCVIVDCLPVPSKAITYQAIRAHLARLPYALRPASISLTPEAASFEGGGRILLSTPRSSPPRGFRHDVVLYLGADLMSPKRRFEHVHDMELCLDAKGGAIWLYCANPISSEDFRAIGNSPHPLLLQA